MNQREAPVVIIGGGIVGSSIAWFLAQRGVKALLLEKSTPGFEASSRAAGGVRAQCRDTTDERKLAMASIEVWKTLAEATGTDVEYTQGGTLRLAATDDRLAELTAQSHEELADGLEVEMWDEAELYRRKPFLAPGFIGAKYCATDGVANPRLVTPAIAAAAARLGAEVWEETEVIGIDRADGRITGVRARNAQGEWSIAAPKVVHAAGPWTPQLSTDLGFEIPIVPSRTIIGRTEPLPRLFTEFISSHDAGVYARPDARGCIHIGAVGRSIGDFEEVTEADVRTYLEKRSNLIPALGEAEIEEVWWGTLAMTPDRTPILGVVEGLDGYYLASGFSGHGFALGPGVGKVMSELILDGEPSVSLDGFSLARFGEDVQFGKGRIQGTG
ncbi:MAG: FAD-binding oxidoreductase [Caldilineaceae bacterium]|nr:FAD-binding oxidoreductase [Caldilineaceae bacterium]